MSKQVIRNHGITAHLKGSRGFFLTFSSFLFLTLNSGIKSQAGGVAPSATIDAARFFGALRCTETSAAGQNSIECKLQQDETVLTTPITLECKDAEGTIACNTMERMASKVGDNSRSFAFGWNCGQKNDGSPNSKMTCGVSMMSMDRETLFPINSILFKEKGTMPSDMTVQLVDRMKISETESVIWMATLIPLPLTTKPTSNLGQGYSSSPSWTETIQIEAARQLKELRNNQ